MATIVVVEDGQGVGAKAADLLQRSGHRVVLCGGGPGAFAPCPLLRLGHCGLLDHADLVIFSALLLGPLLARPYSGIELLRAYRRHPDYGGIPMVVSCVGDPGMLEGAGKVEVLLGRVGPDRLLDTAVRLLDDDHTRRGVYRKGGKALLHTRRRRGQALERV